MKVVRSSWILAKFLEVELTKFTEGLHCWYMRESENLKNDSKVSDMGNKDDLLT